MKCSNHKNKDAQCRCLDCGKLICEECSIKYNGKIICKDCYEDISSTDAKVELQKKEIREQEYIIRVHCNPFLTFITSLIPGAAQMYMGLMHRGIQLLTAFIVSIILMAEVLPSVFVAATFIVWFYSFFDAHQIKKKIRSGIKVKDEYVVDIDIDFIKGISNKKLGIGLLIFGGYILLKNLLKASTRFLGMNLYYNVSSTIERLIIPVGLIVIGVIFLNRSRTD
ncbi:B-box zinc finger protein [Clostridiaceae bacterium M8S5]|nr:B-box zinc finger protein [Clostridiaceae bacterium M8S5]